MTTNSETLSSSGFSSLLLLLLSLACSSGRIAAAFTFTPSSSSSSSFYTAPATTRINNVPFVRPPSSLSPTTTALRMAQRRGRPKGPLRTIEIKPTMNDEITHAEVRVVIPNPNTGGAGKDESLGIMSRDDALARAAEAGVDLILINENAEPPVCKIVDYSKFRYMKEKAAKEKKKNSKASEVKEVKMSYKIDVHDYEVRKKNASKFLTQGNRVKCTVLFRGREVQHDKLGFELLDRLAEDLSKLCSMEGKPKREGRNLSCIISPKPDVLKKINERKRAEERAARKKREASKAEMERKLAEKEAAAEAAAAEAEVVSAKLSVEDDEEADDDDLTLDELLKGDDLTADLFG